MAIERWACGRWCTSADGPYRCSCFFKVDNRILYLAVVDDHSFGTRRAGAFLDSVVSKFKVQRWGTARAVTRVGQVGFQGIGQDRDTREFDAVLKQEMVSATVCAG